MLLITGYLDQGLMVRDCKRLRQNYFKSASWRTDILSCLPTDIFYFFWPPGHCHAEKLPCPVVLRLNRLFRLPRMMEFCDKTETKTGYPNVFRICKVVFAILILIHWNSCFYFGISYLIGFGKDSWVYNLGGENSTLSRQYIYCFYWSTLTLTTIGKRFNFHVQDRLIYAGGLLTGVGSSRNYSNPEKTTIALPSTGFLQRFRPTITRYLFLVSSNIW